ncbi:MAG: ABC transporter permease subunit [Actinomycetota bacterium]
MIVLAADQLRARRVTLTTTALGLLALAVMYLAFFPSIEDQLSSFSEDLPDSLTAFIGDADFSTANGYLRSQVYSLVSPLLLCGVAIAAGAGLARTERDQTLTTTFVMPVRRREIAGAWIIVVCVLAAVGSAAVVVGAVVGGPIAGTDVGIDRVLLATASLLALAALAGAVAVAVSAVTGSPGAALGVAWGVIGGSFLVTSVSNLVNGLSWLGSLSPWSWYGTGEALEGPYDVLGLVLLIAAWVAAVVIAVGAFERRDLQL